MSSLNDEPTLIDKLRRDTLVRQLGDDLINATPPKVYGVHGAWGSGKTSFLCQLQHYLTGTCARTGSGEKPSAEHLWENWTKATNITTVWFEAWRYQHEKAPIVALLQEMAAQLSTLNKLKDEARKVCEITIKSVLLGMESLTKAIGLKASVIEKVGKEWEQQHYTMPLTTNEIRELLKHAVEQLTGKGTLVVLIDDLDRCEPRAAFQLLEGLKIYLNLPNCLFVLAMDQRLIERYIARELAANGPDSAEGDAHYTDLLASEYLEKICQDIVHLPLLTRRAELLDAFLADDAFDIGDQARAWIKAVVHLCAVLPANPRKIKAFANVLMRFYTHRLPTDWALVGDVVEAGGARLHRGAAELVLFAGLYQFHPSLFTQLEQDGADFFTHVLKPFAEGETITHPLMKGLKVPREEDKASQYSHPWEADVFRLGELVRTLATVSKESYQAYLAQESP